MIVPFVIVFMFLERPWARQVAVLLFVVGALTDLLDGYLARLRGDVTLVGKLLDPMADKLLVSSVLIALVEMERLPGWLVILLISREFVISTLRLLALLHGAVIPAAFGGKLKTFLQMLGISMAILEIRGYMLVMLASALVSLASGFLYARRALEVVGSSRS